MASEPAFDFLPAAWGITLSEKAKAEVTQFAEALDKKHILEYIKDCDIRKLGITAKLPKDVGRLNGPVPTGRYLVQIVKVVDITQPTKFQEDFEQGKWRLLALDLSDGEQKMKGIEYVSMQKLDIGVHSPPGTKLLLHSTENMPLQVQNGHVLLRPESVENLGGYVEKLYDSWQASKQVEETRMLWRTEGIKKKEKGEGAPPWVEFDPKKAPRGSKAAEQAKKQAQEEKAMWLKAGPGASLDGVRRGKRDEDEEDQGPRFKVEEFAQDHTADLQSTVNKSAFKQEEKGGKGKKGEGKGERRRGKGRDDDAQEEKRAPTQASCGLAAFLKPSKNGEDVSAFLAPDTAAAGSEWDDAAWDESGWDDGGWDASGWGASGWGASGSSWSGGGYGGGGRGRKGGKGGRKGGGGGGKKGGKRR